MEVARYKFEVDHRFLQRVPAISTCRETSPPSSASTGAGEMDIRIRSGSMSSAYYAEYEESDSDTDNDCNAIDMSVIKNDLGQAGRDQRAEAMEVDGSGLRPRQRRAVVDDLMVVERVVHGPPPPQLVMRDPHSARDDMNRVTNESPLSSSGSSSSPSLLIAGGHPGSLPPYGLGQAAGSDGHGRPGPMGGPTLPPPSFLSQLAQPGANHIMQHMQQQHVASAVPGGQGILLAANDPKGRHSSFSSVNSSDGTVSPPPHTLPNSNHHNGNSLNQHQLPFVPQHIPHDLVHKMSSGQKKKLPTPIPKECKDEAYWERRKRNNESAKRSRELRRIKEQQTTLRVLYLEQENLQLRTELGMLRSEVDKLRQLLYVTNKQARNGSHYPGLTGQAAPGSEAIGDEAQLGQQHAVSALTSRGMGPQHSGGLHVVASPPPPSPPASGQLLAGPGQHLQQHQPLPPISTLQNAMSLQSGQPTRQIILASPSRNGHQHQHSLTSHPMSPVMSRSPSPSRRSPASMSPTRTQPPQLSQRPSQGHRSCEFSTSPQVTNGSSPSSSRDAIDLSPLSPPQQKMDDLSPPPGNPDQTRPLALVHAAGESAGQQPDNGNGEPRAGQRPFNGAGEAPAEDNGQRRSPAPPPAERHQQHPLQPAILRHKKARPPGPFRASLSPNLAQMAASNPVNNGRKANEEAPGDGADYGRLHNGQLAMATQHLEPQQLQQQQQLQSQRQHSVVVQS